MSYHGGLDGPDLRQWDPRAILVGALLQTVGVGVVVLSGLPRLANFVPIALAAVVVTKISRSYGREFADAAAGATVGAVVAFVALMGLTYLGTASLTPVQRADTLLETLFFGTGIMMAGGMLATLVAVLVGLIFGRVFRE